MRKSYVVYRAGLWTIDYCMTFYNYIAFVLYQKFKKVQAMITKSLLCTASKTLVYRDKISCSWGKEFTSNEGVKEGYP